jgi:hypothetical protein
MKVFIAVTLFILILVTACTVQKKALLPSCIQQKITAIQKEPQWNPPAEVNEYLYEGKTVYLFSSPCCDQYNVAYDKDCQSICAPSGGITGKGDRKCMDFQEKATLVRVVWKDNR